MSQKTPWRQKVEGLILEGKSNAEILLTVGNPYPTPKRGRDKVSAIRKQMQDLQSIPSEEKSILQQEAEQAGIPLTNVKYFWFKNKRISINATNDRTVEEVMYEVVQEMIQHAPSYPTLPRLSRQTGNMIVIDPADVHIGKLARAYETGDEYNSQVAVARVMEGVRSLLAYASFHSAEKIVLTIGGDIMHVDNKRRTTTSGTPQDTDVMWYDQYKFALKLYVDIIEQLIPIADVHVVHNMSNHDNVMGWCLAQNIQAWFNTCKNVTFDVSPNPRKGLLWGRCLVVFTHGEEKEERLALSIPHEFRDEWSKASWCNVHKQHIHHKTMKDHMGVTIQTSRSVSGADSWHHAQGYSHAPKGIECFVYSKEYGQIATYTHYFK